MKRQLAASDLSIFKTGVVVASLVLLANGGPALSYKVVMHFGPRNLLASFPDNPLVSLPLLVLAELGGIVLLLISAGIGVIIWLLLMKLFLSKCEMSIFLGLELGKSSRSKRLLKKLVDVVY